MGRVSLWRRIGATVADVAKYAIPDGWTARGFAFEVEWPEDRSTVLSHFGARRKAKNWAIGQVKADMDAKKTDPSHQSVPWNFYALRNAWNQAKAEVAPWWSDNSKCAYSSGVQDAVRALDNWTASRKGARKGRKVGFPRFESKRRGHNAVRFDVSPMRAEPDRRTITLPVVGKLASKESTRRLERLIRTGGAKILNATLTERWGRLFVSFGCIVQQQRPKPAMPHATVGVDLGLRKLATLVDTEGNVVEVENPAPLRATLTDRRRAGRQMNKRIIGSKGHRSAKAKLAKLDRRCVNLRKQASHQLTTDLVRTYGRIVIEDLDLAAMKRSMGRRAFRRSVSDATLGQIRPQLVYKTAWHGGELVVADRWFASSQIHQGCGCRLHFAKKLARFGICATTGELVNRDWNAGANLRDWPDTNTGVVHSSALPDKLGRQASDASPRRARNRKTTTSRGASSGEARNGSEKECQGVST